MAEEKRLCFEEQLALHKEAGRPFTVVDIFDVVDFEYHLLNHERSAERPDLNLLLGFVFAASQSEELKLRVHGGTVKRFSDIFPDNKMGNPDYNALADYVLHVSTETKYRVRRNLKGFAKNISNLQPRNKG